MLHHQGEAIYFNPSAATWTWELNRAWLQAGVYLGYKFMLVEQHFPAIETAILSGDTSKFVLQLVNEMRPESSANTSQYNGDYSPTATTQEILVLMDMGCVARKMEDGRLVFYPPVTREEPPIIYETLPAPGLLRRSHSCIDFGTASPPPPFDNRKDHFIDVSKSDKNLSIFSIKAYP